MTKELTSYQRVKKALNHQEPDQIPLGFGSHCSGIHIGLYKQLRNYYNLEKNEPEIIDRIQQLAKLDEDFQNLVGNDVEGIFLNPPSAWKFKKQDLGDYWYFEDEFDIGWRMPKKKGLYYDMYKHPLQKASRVQDIEEFEFIDPRDDNRFTDLRKQLELAKQKKRAPIVNPNTGGMFEMALWIRGFAEFYMDMAGNTKMAEALLEKTLNYKMKFWEKVLDIGGKDLLIIGEADDIASQNSTLISPKMYRNLIKPRHKKLFNFIKNSAQCRVYILYHSCGAVRELIPDLIEEGIDILNPVQLSAKDMKPEELKKEFGQDITFWGGGIDTQKTLPYGNPEEVKEETRRNIEQFAPGGGFIFATVHNAQADVPPENFAAMLETLDKYGKY